MDLGIKDVVLIFNCCIINLINRFTSMHIGFSMKNLKGKFNINKSLRRNTDYKKLLSKLRDKARIESIAQNDLNMVPISLKNTITLKVETSK